jgi:hypothetical protein
MVITLIVTGAWGRFLIAAQGDRSVLNRFTLWTGGLRMIADRPLAGWGNGTAGVNFDNWYQDLSSSTVHGTMVNSYLNIGVEWGLPALGVVLFGLFFSVFSCLYLERVAPAAHKGLLAGSTAIIVFFALVNVGYSTIYYVLPLVVLAVAVLIVAGFCVWEMYARRIYMECGDLSPLLTVGLVTPPQRGSHAPWYHGRPTSRPVQSGDKSPHSITRLGLVKSLVFAASASVVCVFTLYLGGVYARQNDSVRVKLVAEGNVLLRKSEDSASAINLTIAPDYRMLGLNYGQPIRKALVQDANYSGTVQVLEPEADFNACAGENVLVLGARIRDWGTRTARDGQRIVFVCPTAPPSGQPQVRQLFLPPNDIWPVAAAWKEWAEKNGCPITFLEGNGFLDEGNMKTIWEYSKAVASSG